MKKVLFAITVFAISALLLWVSRTLPLSIFETITPDIAANFGLISCCILVFSFIYSILLVKYKWADNWGVVFVLVPPFFSLWLIFTAYHGVTVGYLLPYSLGTFGAHAEFMTFSLIFVYVTLPFTQPWGTGFE